MTGLDQIRESMTALLKKKGVQAVTAWPNQARKRLDGPVAAVSLKACEGGPSGLQDYLGEQFDQATGQWRELYGRRCRMTFGLDLYAPRESGAAGCQAAFDALAGALSGGGPAGVHLRALTREAVVFDQETGLFHCPVEAECDAYLYAVADDEGDFLDFVVKGEQTWD